MILRKIIVKREILNGIRSGLRGGGGRLLAGAGNQGEPSGGTKTAANGQPAAVSLRLDVIFLRFWMF
ncbi:MAG: hypothetical protein MJY93_11075 [Fibrobacter sp.]|nr:hypothetical protein [Fibrobacter sp.]